MTLKLRLHPRPSIIARVTPRLSGATLVAGDNIDIDQVGNVYTISATSTIDAQSYNGMQINGSMEVNQEFGTGGTAIPLLATGNSFDEYVADGWNLVGAGGATGSNLQCHTIAPVAALSRFSKCLQVYSDTHGFVAATNDTLVIRQLVEGYRIARLAFGTADAQPLTLAFWFYTSVAGQMGIVLRNANASRNITKNVTMVAGVNFQTITFPGDTSGTWNSTNGIGLYIDFILASGSAGLLFPPDVWAPDIGFGSAGQANFLSGTGDTAVQLTGVVVLPGTAAPTEAQSPLIMRSYDQELMTCQRYLWKPTFVVSQFIATLQAISATETYGHIFQFPVELRASPTVTVSSTGHFSLQPAAGGNSVVNSFQTVATSVHMWANDLTCTGGLAAGNAAALFSNTNGAWIMLDARL